MPAATTPTDTATDEPERTWLSQAEQSDHFLALEGANIVATRALTECAENLEEVLEKRAMTCVYGDAGYGKSLSVNAVLRDLAPHNTMKVVFRSRPTTRDIRNALFHGLGLTGKTPGHPIDFDRLLKAHLAERFRVIVCDEAQWMKRECFEYWRHLWDDPATQISIVFVGGGDCFSVLSREPMLASRLYLPQRFRRMGLAEVLQVIPVYHPVWNRALPTLLDEIDTKACKGNFRNWAKFTHHVLQARKRRPDAPLDRDMAKWVYRRLGTGTV